MADARNRAPARRPRVKRRRLPNWRKLTWAILIINVLFLVWIVSGLADVADNCEGLVGSELDACEAGTAVGASIGIGAILFLAMIVNVILGIIWLVTRPNQR